MKAVLNMIERLEAVENKYLEISEELTRPEVLANVNKTRELSKELSNLEDSYNAFIKYKKVLNEIEENKELLKDHELGEMAKEELVVLEEEKLKIEKELELLLIAKDPNDGKNVIVEIRGAAGGDEANIFAGDLYRMYSKYAEKVGFTTELLDSIEGDSGGFTNISFMVKGKNVYSKLKYESGAHRVQRIPLTEANGRIQTSTATVLVMPEASSVDIDIKESDVKIDVYRASGAGGQHVNTTDSAVRMTHIPTGLVVTCQAERSQFKNRERAFAMLKTKVYEEELRIKEEKLGTERRNKIGRGDRSEKIRTYNYPQNRVTDHQINYSSMQLDRIMEGDLEDIIEALINEDQRRKLADE
ncbi:MAG: peptide chain release factor 1 [Bacilli bacterium]